LGDQRVEVLRDIGTLTAHPVLLERVLLMIVDASTAAGAAALSFAAETVEDKAVLVIRYRGTRPTKVDRWPLVKAMCAAQAIEAERETGEAETTIRLAGRRAVHAR
jgi:head-tail adaptor